MWIGKNSNLVCSWRVTFQHAQAERSICGYLYGRWPCPWPGYKQASDRHFILCYQYTHQMVFQEVEYSGDFNLWSWVSGIENCYWYCSGIQIHTQNDGDPLEGPSPVLCDNIGVVLNTTLPSSTLKKKQNAIAYHRVTLHKQQECYVILRERRI